MGINQLPATPTPTAKGSIVVGTGTGATLLPASATNNLPLVTDSTQTTGLKYSSPTKLWTLYNVPFTATVSGNPTPYQTPSARMIYAGGIYAFCVQRYLYYSTDGKNWNTQLVGSSSLYTIATNASGSVWVIGGDTNTLYSGVPGGTWTARTSQLSGTGAIFNIKWIPSYNLFVLTGQINAAPWTIISTSPDGVTWTGRYNHPQSVSTYGVALANNLSTTTVIGFDNTTTRGAFSTNGTSWTATDLNGTSYNRNVIWLPTAGRFQCLGGNQYSQTAAAVGTAWSTAPTTTYYGMAYTPLGDSYNTGIFYEPYYDATTQRWYSIGFYGPSQNSMLFTFDDTTSYLFRFDTGVSNQYVMRMINMEPLPYGTINSLGSSQIAFLNGNFFFYYSANNNFYIWTTTP
jgi:hypothetical protein